MTFIQLKELKTVNTNDIKSESTTDLSGKAQSFLVLGFGAERDRKYDAVREKKRKESLKQ